MKNLFYVSLYFIVGIGFFGCGGGGGSAISSEAFNSWSSVNYPSIVTIGGISADASYTAPAPDYTITSTTDHGFSTSSSATIKYRADGTIERVDIVTPNVTLFWDENAGDIIDDSDIIVAVNDPAESKVGLFANAIDPLLAWEYQTFGIWETGRGLGSGTIGAITLGSPTPDNAIPLTGNVPFLGLSSGVYLDSTGTTDYITVSNVLADVDFFNHNVTLTTSGTQKINTTTAEVTDAFNLNLTGTLSYVPGSNSFSGDVAATGLNGTSTGQFYGPSAQELGGVFSLSGAGFEGYVGAYGATQ